MIHLATIPVDNTSVNPARSIGAAVFSGGDAMAQLWAFIVWPMVGGVVGVVVWAVVHGERFGNFLDAKEWPAISRLATGMSLSRKNFEN